ncbi:hypothetical protein L6267_02805 [Candidatus Parcubacteria bacterium]|nr:hypothetical protein [Candidatus Parcubacteria bacterium]
MKKYIVLLLTISLAMVWLSGCALFTPPPYINQTMEIEKNANGDVVKSKYHRTVKGLAYEDPETVILEWADAEKMARNSKDNAEYQTSYQQKCVYLKIRNSTKNYSVIIRSEPFKGLELGPGEVSKTKKRFTTGTYPLTFHWYRLGEESEGEKTVNISIYENRREPITITP